MRNIGRIARVALIAWGIVPVVRGQNALDLVQRGIEQGPLDFYNCTFPADQDLAVGPSRIVLVSNCKVRLLDSAGAQISEAFLRDGTEFDPSWIGLFPPTEPGVGGLQGSRMFDPRVHWDPRYQRFWIAAGEHAEFLLNLPIGSTVYDKGWLHVAVSKTATPSNLSFNAQTGDWYHFKFDMKADLNIPLIGILDRPTINTDNEFLHVAVRDLLCDPFAWGRGFCNGHSPVPAEEHRTVLVPIPLAPMLNGQYPALPLFSLKLDPSVVPEDSGMHCAVRTYDAVPGQQTQYEVTTDVHPFASAALVRSSIVVGSFAPDGAGGWTYTSQAVPLPESAWFFGILRTRHLQGPPQSNPTTVRLIPGMFQSAALRNGSIWGVLHGRKNVGSPGSPTPGDRYMVFWFEIAVAGGTFALKQSGEIDPENVFDIADLEGFDPSISVQADNSVAITYSITGPTVYPTMVMAYRYSTSPDGAMPYHPIVRDGLVTLKPEKTADYSGTEADTSGCFFWGHSMLAWDDGTQPMPPDPTESDHWQTWVGRINLCIDDMWADFDGDAELTMFDWLEFTYLQRTSDRRADVNRDRRHDIIDFERVAHALRNVR
jgi:hypothetical protein